ncbi:MAG: hypothetical protein JXO49_07285 [Deltaproteobacteria bacterium]|nr:hypothetical protein [Candidatus Anaeroferrophillus wilburensis]MBN2889131.1 hypothetical protein [Deltaproteobacteria bacterium]
MKSSASGDCVDYGLYFSCLVPFGESPFPNNGATPACKGGMPLPATVLAAGECVRRLFRGQTRW